MQTKKIKKIKKKLLKTIDIYLVLSHSVFNEDGERPQEQKKHKEKQK